MIINAIQGVDGCMQAFDSGMSILTARAEEIGLSRALEQTTRAYNSLSARYDQLLSLSTRVTDQLQAQLAKERATNRMLRGLLDDAQ